MPKSILDVDFVEEGDHIFGLVFGGIEVFNAIKDDYYYDLVGHDACIIEEVLVALLDALYGCLQHVLRLTVHADTNRQLYMALLRAFEQRKQSVACWVFDSSVLILFGVYGKLVYLVFVDLYGFYFLFLVLIGLLPISLDYFDPCVFVQPDFGRLQEDLREEILHLEDFIVVGLLQVLTFKHYQN